MHDAIGITQAACGVHAIDHQGWIDNAHRVSAGSQVAEVVAAVSQSYISPRNGLAKSGTGQSNGHTTQGAFSRLHDTIVGLIDIDGTG